MTSRLRIGLSLALATAPIGGCMAADHPSCFTKRPSVVLPDRRLVLAHVSNGTSGRAIAEAVLDGRIDEVRAMLTRDPRLIETVVTHDPRADAAPKGQYGDLLTLAVSRCEADGVKALLNAGMSPNGVQRGSALSLAVLADTPDLAELLLNAGASPDPLPQGEDAMRSAITFSNLGAVMTLVRHGANPRWADTFGIDRVRFALDGEQAEIAEFLVEKGGTLFGVASDGSMAAHELLAEPLVFNGAAMQAARKRLVARAEQSGMPWPLPDRAAVRERVTSGAWPTPEMAKAGMVVPPVVLEKLRPVAH